MLLLQNQWDAQDVELECVHKLTQLLFYIQKTHVWAVVTVVWSLICECLLFLPLSHSQFWIYLRRMKAELQWEWGQKVCAAVCELQHKSPNSGGTLGAVLPPLGS